MVRASLSSPFPVVPPLWAIAHTDSRHDSHDHPRNTKSDERGLPAVLVKCPRKRKRRNDLAKLPNDARQLRHHRHSVRRKPYWNKPHDGGKSRRISQADQHSRAKSQCQVIRERKSDLSAAHEDAARDNHAAHTDLVEEHPDRDLSE